jgi:deoxyribonuclease V
MHPGVPCAVPDYSGLSYSAAVEMQEHLRGRLSAIPPRSPVRTVAGADVAFADAQTAVAGFLVFTWPGLAVVDMAIASRDVTFPYIPGLLSFREVPVLAQAFARLSARPDVIFCDGQGTAHPRGMGLACHLGLTLAVPTIGVAKSRLCGRASEPGHKRGSAAPLVLEGRIVGSVLRTKDGVKPLFVSPGHMMNLETAVDMVLAAGRGYRLPEPTRQADALVGKARRIIG